MFQFEPPRPPPSTSLSPKTTQTITTADASSCSPFVHSSPRSPSQSLCINIITLGARVHSIVPVVHMLNCAQLCRNGTSSNANSCILTYTHTHTHTHPSSHTFDRLQVYSNISANVCGRTTRREIATSCSCNDAACIRRRDMPSMCVSRF